LLPLDKNTRGPALTMAGNDWAEKAAARAAEKNRFIELETQRSKIEAECPVFFSLRMRRVAECVFGVGPIEVPPYPSPAPCADMLDVSALVDPLALAITALAAHNRMQPSYIARFLRDVAKRAVGPAGKLPLDSTVLYKLLLDGYQYVTLELKPKGVNWAADGELSTIRPVIFRNNCLLETNGHDALPSRPRPKRVFCADMELQPAILRRQRGAVRAWFGDGPRSRQLPGTVVERRRCENAAAVAAMLPLAGQRTELQRLIRENQVLLVQAETGSGKTTQVPRYILEMADADVEIGVRRPSAPVRIVCTQPRRIAAVSVAHRVSSEFGEAFGGGTIGYKIRGESRVSPSTRILYCTVGVLLRRIAAEGLEAMFSAETVTHLVVDEIHERSSEVDFLLTFVRQALPRCPELKLVIMSATIDVDSFVRYFSRQGADGNVVRPPVMTLPGRLFPVDVVYREPVERTLFPKKLEEDEKRKKRKEDKKSEAAKRNQSATLDPMRDGFDAKRRGGNYQTSRQRWDDEDEDDEREKDGIPFDLIAKLVSRITTSLHGAYGLVEGRQGPPENAKVDGACILIFLPGVAEILEAIEALKKEPTSARWWILPLHGSLAIDEQQHCFSTDWQAKFSAKVVCATNVAETSVTIPDVTVVVDSCRERRNQVDRYSNTPALREQFCAIDSLTQRRGRAGRVQPGVCFRLIQEELMKELPTITTPEMRRVPLENLYLQVCACGIEDRIGFLKTTPDPPEETAILFAESVLNDIGALDLSQRDGLTPLGRHLAMLPCNPRLGKVLLLGCLLDCPGPCISIVSALSMRSPFVHTWDMAQRDLWVHRRSLLTEVEGCYRSDHCVWALLLHRWMLSGPAVHARLCAYYGLSYERMKQAVSERKHLIESLVNAGLVPHDFAETERGDLAKERRKRRDEVARRVEQRCKPVVATASERDCNLAPQAATNGSVRGGGRGDAAHDFCGRGLGGQAGAGGRGAGRGEQPGGGRGSGRGRGEQQKHSGDPPGEIKIIWEVDPEMDEGWENLQIDWIMVRAAVVGGLYPNVVKVERMIPHAMPRGGQAEAWKSLRFWAKQRHHSMKESLSYPKGVDIHPGSLLFGTEIFDCPFLVFFTLQQTKKLFTYDVSEASTFALLLFGSPPVFDEDTGHIELGGWARLWCPSASTVIPVIKAARSAVSRVLEEKLQDPSADHGASRELAVCLAMLRTNGLGFMDPMVASPAIM